MISLMTNVTVSAGDRQIVIKVWQEARAFITVNPPTGGRVTVTRNGEEITEAAPGTDGIVLTAFPEGAHKFLKWTISGALEETLTTHPATFKMPEGDVTIDVRLVVPPPRGAIINGVIWASANVDAPGTFVASGKDAGMFYQWGQKVGWSATDPMTPSDGTSVWLTGLANESRAPWPEENDPCPAGWRVPTNEEQKSLEDAGGEWTKEGDVKGRRFSGGEGSIFMPAVGYRGAEGEITNAEEEYTDPEGKTVKLDPYGYYWSSSAGNASMGRYFYFSSTGMSTQYLNAYSDGFTVRCVAR
jgi:uncharacterized protein (TIGR02145 family)